MEIPFAELGDIALRSLISVLVLFIIAKIIGSRQIAQLTFYDYILGITVGSIAAAVAVDTTLPLWGGVIALLIYCFVSVGMSLSGSKSIFCRRFFTGKPEILFYKGQFLEEKLKKNKLDMDDITGLCRVHGYFDLSQLDYIIMETNGSLSFLPKSEYAPLTPNDIKKFPPAAALSANVIIDGHIMEEHLRSIGKDTRWLKEQLRNKELEAKEILLATADEFGNFNVFLKDQKEKRTNLFN